MSTETQRYRLGIFVVSGVALTVVGVAALSAGRLFQETYPLYCYFQESVQGLEPGSPVKFRGVQIGRVEAVNLMPSSRIATQQEGSHAESTIEVRSALQFKQITERESSGDLARRGFELAGRARLLAPGRVEAHYRYAVCLGIYLRENRLSGIARVGDLMSAARRAAELDGSYDRGGPHRLLARIYAEAPRLVGPGDHDLARTHLARLLELAGQDDENRLTAVSVHLSLGDEERARELLAKLDGASLRSPSLRRERERLERALRD